MCMVKAFFFFLTGFASFAPAPFTYFRLVIYFFPECWWDLVGVQKGVRVGVVTVCGDGCFS